MPQLELSTYLPQVFWAAVMFALMLGMFIGFIMPKMASALQKRKDFVLDAEEKLKILTKQNLELEESYQSQKASTYVQLQNEIEKSLQTIRETHDKKISSLETEMTVELQILNKNFENQLANFDETYKDLITESVDIALKKVGFKNGR